MRLNRLNGARVAAVVDWFERRNRAISEARAPGQPVPADPLDRRARPKTVGARTP